MKQKIIVFTVLMLILLVSTPAAFASIKVMTEDKPVFISSHMMGSDIIKHANGMTSLDNILMGFAGMRFPLEAKFKTLTTFTATASYESPVSTVLITNYSGKINLARYDFSMMFNGPGSMHTQAIEWKISFPEEGFYAFNIFVDGALVGYYPFYVWQQGIILQK